MSSEQNPTAQTPAISETSTQRAATSETSAPAPVAATLTPAVKDPFAVLTSTKPDRMFEEGYVHTPVVDSSGAPYPTPVAAPAGGYVAKTTGDRQKPMLVISNSSDKLREMLEIVSKTGRPAVSVLLTDHGAHALPDGPKVPDNERALYGADYLVTTPHDIRKVLGQVDPRHVIIERNFSSPHFQNGYDIAALVQEAGRGKATITVVDDSQERDKPVTSVVQTGNLNQLSFMVSHQGLGY